MIFIIGDTYGDFRRVAEFCKRILTEKEDILIILGDAESIIMVVSMTRQQKNF